MSNENKFLVGAGILTLIAILVGVFFFSGKDKIQTQQDKNFNTSQLTDSVKHSKGTQNGQVTIVEFGDIQCPACAQAQPIINSTIEKYKDNIYFVFRHYPLTIHKNAEFAAKAAEAAGEQDKFFEMVDVMYSNQLEWSNDTNPREDFRKYAQELSLNLDQFNQDMEKDWENIPTDYALGNSAGVQSTPTFFINGEIHPGVVQAEELDMIIQSYIQASPEATSASNSAETE